MWMLIRLVAALLALAARLMRDQRPLSASTPVGTSPVLQNIRRDKKKRIQGFSIGLAVPGLPRFRLQPEREVDRLAKILGLATEFQTGDQGFDHAVYIACDHPGLLHPLRDDAGIRMLIRQVFATGFARLHCEGERLWLDRQANREPDASERALLMELGAALSKLSVLGRWWTDPFAVKVIAIEAAIWSLAGYAAASLFETALKKGDVHVEPLHLLPPGLLLAAVLFLLLFGATVLLLRQSSWSHRVLLEAGLVLLLSLPMIGVQSASDLNRELDRSQTVVVVRQIQALEVRRHKRSTSHYLVLRAAAGPEPISLPQRVRISPALYSSARAGAEVEFHLGHGRLGLPWYRLIRIRP